MEDIRNGRGSSERACVEVEEETHAGTSNSGIHTPEHQSIFQPSGGLRKENKFNASDKRKSHEMIPLRRLKICERVVHKGL